MDNGTEVKALQYAKFSIRDLETKIKDSRDQDCSIQC